MHSGAKYEGMFKIRRSYVWLGCFLGIDGIDEAQRLFVMRELFRRARRTGLDHQDIEPLDFGHRATRDALQIAIQTRGGIENAVELRLAPRPQLGHGLALAVKIVAHIVELFEDGI